MAAALRLRRSYRRVVGVQVPLVAQLTNAYAVYIVKPLPIGVIGEIPIWCHQE